MWRVLRFLPLVLVLALATTVAYADHIPLIISGSGSPLEVGTGATEWSSELWTEDPSGIDDTPLVGPGAATLAASVEDGSTGIAGAMYLLDTPAPLFDFFPLGPLVDNIEIGEASWDPIVGVLVDVDGDGYEADPAAWQLGGFDPADLGDDTFIQCERLFPPATEEGWFFLYIFDGTWACYTPNDEGDGYAPFYGAYYTLIFIGAGRVDPEQEAVGVYAWIGGSSSWIGQTTLFDNFYYALFSELGDSPFRVLILDPPVGVPGLNRYHPKVVDSVWAPEGQDMVGVWVYSANHWGDQFEFTEVTHDGGGVAFIGAPDGDYYAIYRWCRDGEIREYRNDFSFGGAVDIVSPLIDLSEVDSEVVGTC